jgi:hypothetical protein
MNRRLSEFYPGYYYKLILINDNVVLAKYFKNKDNQICLQVRRDKEVNLNQ